MFLVYFFKVVEIVRTFGIYAFMYAEEGTVFLCCKGMPAMRAGKLDRRGHQLTSNKSLSTDFTLVLSVTAIVVVKVMMGGTTEWADGTVRNGFTIASLNRLHSFTIAPGVVLQEELPVLLDKRFDDGELVHFELLVFRRVRVIKSPLLERDVSADEI